MRAAVIIFACADLAAGQWPSILLENIGAAGEERGYAGENARVRRDRRACDRRAGVGVPGLAGVNFERQE